MNEYQTFIVRKAAVLGAGVMGAQIAAHLVNANIETLLFELPAEQGDPNANVSQGSGKSEKAGACPTVDPCQGRLYPAGELCREP